MQNIDPLLVVEPVIFVLLSVGAVLYWRLRRKFAAAVLLYSLIAYATAIALKEVVQYFTANAVFAEFGYSSWETGLYFGLQTSFFEVGLAYLIARHAVSRKRMDASDAEGYGIGLGFWENGILLGALSFLNLLLTYLLIAGNLLPQSVYQTLVSSEPSLFLPPQQLAFPIALATLERFSSLLAHLAWGYLCVLAAALRKPKLFYIALPMGLLDFLVPFAPEVPAWVFELVVFLLSLGFVLVALRATRSFRTQTIVEDDQREILPKP